tara:strand:+ start:1780 stop:2514 length:735 start_codon:yes stop_codon:yes gene_type:complete
MKTLIKILCLSVLWFSCENDVQGCTDSDACNFNSNATTDDNSCYYPEDWEDECGVCDLVPSNDCEQDCNGIWGGDNEGYVKLWGECYNIETTTELYLYMNQLTGEIPSDIGKLINLEILNLNENQLTGEIPVEIGNLTYLTRLELYNNQLTGEIPPEIGNLTNLTYLRLHNNQLTGEIPPEIGNLTNLTSLSLSYNQLSGVIPSEICNQGDNTPNVNNNQLCPPYPDCISQGDNTDTQDTSNCP